MLVSNVDKHTKEEEIPVRLCNYVNVYKNERISQNLRFMRATASAEEIDRFRLRLGDVIITKDSEAWDDIGVPALVQYAAADLICGYHLAILRPRDGVVLGAFLLRALQSQGVASQYFVAANGVTRYGLSHDGIKSVFLPIPPLPEQSAIVRFLDHADKRIKRCIAAKRRLIELLNEQKQAIIQKAVTRGLDPTVRLKPSGVGWFGDIPEHWELRRVRSLIASIDQGVSPQAEAALADETSWGVLKAGCVNHGVFREREHKRLPKEFAFDPNLAVRVGDVLVSRACGSPKLVGSVARVRSLRYPLILSDKTFRLNFREPRMAEFLVLAMNSGYFRIQVEKAISGAEGLANNLPLSALKDFRLAVPCATEAEAITKSLADQTAEIHAVRDSAAGQAVLMGEYRTRLIADVVTGKLDVRGVELPPWEEAEDLPALADEAINEPPEEETELEPVEEGADGAD